MSKASRFKKDRLFQFRNSFTYGDNDYVESFYYLIKDVEYNNEYKKIGYNYYLLKPIKKENLNDILDEYIK